MQDEVNTTVAKLRTASNPIEALNLFRQHSREELKNDLQFAAQALSAAVEGFTHENLKELRHVMASIEEKKEHLKQVKRVGTLGVTQLDRDIAIDKGLYYYQSNDFASEIVYSIRRLVEPCKQHIDNNFNPLDEIQKKDFTGMDNRVISYLNRCAEMIEKNNYEIMPSLVDESNQLVVGLTQLKKEELKRIQGQSGSTKVSMVYLNMLHETINVVNFACNLIKVSKKFQME